MYTMLAMLFTQEIKTVYFCNRQNCGLIYTDVFIQWLINSKYQEPNLLQHQPTDCGKLCYTEKQDPGLSEQTFKGEVYF